MTIQIEVNELLVDFFDLTITHYLSSVCEFKLGQQPFNFLKFTVYLLKYRIEIF